MGEKYDDRHSDRLCVSGVYGVRFDSCSPREELTRNNQTSLGESAYSMHDFFSGVRSELILIAIHGLCYVRLIYAACYSHSYARALAALYYSDAEQLNLDGDDQSIHHGCRWV